MPLVQLASSRYRRYGLRLTTVGTGNQPELQPPPPVISVPVDGRSPVFWRGPVSRYRPRLLLGLGTSGTGLQARAPLFGQHPVSRYKPRRYLPPVVAAVQGAASIFGSTDPNGLTSTSATQVADGQIDHYDTGNEVAVFQAQNATFSASVAAVVHTGTAALSAGQSSMQGGGLVGVSGGSGQFNSTDAAMSGAGEIDYLNTVDPVSFNAQSASMQAQGIVESPVFTIQQFWEFMMDGQREMIKILKDIHAATVGPTQGVQNPKGPVSFIAPTDGQVQVTTDSADGKNRSTTTLAP